MQRFRVSSFGLAAEELVPLSANEKKQGRCWWQVAEVVADVVSMRSGIMTAWQENSCWKK